ncbi:glycosyltransferase [Enterococcus sp. AZ109]|uniref:glycosyltransferase n=1 Tax=Enterococcus sp. AZ109 TaxID=2774634 RepID=UPI003F223D0C
MFNQTIVFTPATFNLAETTRMIEVAKELRTSCNCQFFGFSTTHAALITKNGFPFTLLAPVLTKEQERQIIALDQMKGITNPFTTELVAARVKSELDFLQKQRPKVVITGTNVTIFLSARIAKIPLVYVKPYALSRPQLENDAQTLIDALMSKITWKPKAFRKVAKNYQLTLPKYSIELLDGDENLITTFRDFTNWQSYPANYHNIGPVFAQLADSLPPDLEATLKVAQQNQQPIVYFALGSSGNPQLARNILAVLQDTDFLVLAPIKQYLSDEEIADYQGSLIRITDLLPAPLLAPYLSFSIIHGGEGTVQTACISGKPFIGYGLQQEQTMNLKYCEAYGNAIRLRAKPFSAKALMQTITAIQTAGYQEKAAKLAEDFHGDGGKNAARFIEKKYLKKLVK